VAGVAGIKVLSAVGQEAGIIRHHGALSSRGDFGRLAPAGADSFGISNRRRPALPGRSPGAGPGDWWLPAISAQAGARMNLRARPRGLATAAGRQDDLHTCDPGAEPNRQTTGWKLHRPWVSSEVTAPHLIVLHIQRLADVRLSFI
jgi:hypothetical protein